MCKKRFQSNYVYRYELARASFTYYSKATRVRKFYTAYTGVIETNYIRRFCLNYVNAPWLTLTYVHV